MNIKAIRNLSYSYRSSHFLVNLLDHPTIAVVHNYAARLILSRKEDYYSYLLFEDKGCRSGKDRAFLLTIIMQAPGYLI
jgi:hypothetical protein